MTVTLRYIFALLLIIVCYLLIFNELILSEQYQIKGVFLSLAINILFFLLIIISNKLPDKYKRKSKSLRLFSKMHQIKYFDILFILLIVVNLALLIFNVDDVRVIKLTFLSLNLLVFLYLTIKSIFYSK